MTNGAGAEAVKGAVELVKAGAANPSMRKSGENLAFGLEVVTGIVKTALLPLAVVNARAKDFFEAKFPEELSNRLKDVPPESIVSPKPSLAGPALQGLGYSHEEIPLRDLYLNLLAKSMDGREPTAAHPGFAEVISALSAEEVGALQVLLKFEQLGLAQIRASFLDGTGFVVLLRHLAPFLAGEGTPYLNPLTPAYIDNWVRLGLADASYADHLVSPDAYAWVADRPEYQNSEVTEPDKMELVFEKGLLRLTAFGKAFAHAVGDDSPSAT